jgi:hypothetical protein
MRWWGAIFRVTGFRTTGPVLRSPAPSRRPLDSIFHHLAGDGVSVDAEQIGSAPHTPFRSLQRARDEQLFELPTRVVVEHALVEHLLDELLELVAHGGYCSSRPESRVKASTYLSRVRRTTSSGSDGTGGCLFQRMRSR